MHKILIIEDHPEIRQLIRITLGHAFEILEAADGETALTIALEQKPALIVLDIGLTGEIDGIQVLDEIRKSQALASTKTVIASGRASAEDIEYGYQHGAHAYFCKPFSPVQLVNTIKELLA